MRKESIIDKDFFAGWKNYVFHEDEIKWSGKPQIEPTIRFLEKGFYHDVMTGVTSGITIYTIFLISIVYGMYELNFYIPAIIIALLGITIPFLVEYFRYKNQLNTEYAITNKYVLFKFYNGFSYKVQAIPTEKLIKIHVKKEVDNIGTIFLITSEKVNFSTHNWKTGARRDHPTLELVKNYEEASSILYKLIAKNPPGKLVYQAPTIIGAKLKTTKIVLVFLLTFMSIYLMDFFVLPSQLVVDQGSSISRNIVESGRYRPSQDLGGTYKTKNKLSFSTSDYFPNLRTEKLELKVSPIFKIVTGVKDSGMDYTDRLTSSLNSIITRSFYFIAYFVILGSFFSLRNKTSIKTETLWEVIISSSVFLVILVLVWRIYN